MFNRKNVKEFRNDFQLAVAALEKDYGCNISLGTISFDAESISAKMKAIIGDKIEILTKDDFKVGEIVGINHKKVNPNDTFTIVKINNKNIKVKGDSGMINVSPNLLVKKTFKTI